MRSDVVIFLDPAIDGCLGLVGGLKPVCIQDFIAKRAIESFIISVLPGTPWVNVNGFDADAFEPCLEEFGDKLWPIIRANKFGFSVFDDERV